MDSQLQQVGQVSSTYILNATVDSSMVRNGSVIGSSSSLVVPHLVLEASVGLVVAFIKDFFSFGSLGSSGCQFSSEFVDWSVDNSVKSSVSVAKVDQRVLRDGSGCSHIPPLIAVLVIPSQGSQLPLLDSKDELCFITDSSWASQVVLFYEQQPNVSLSVNSQLHWFTFVYASTFAIILRSLWQSLRDLFSLVSSSWMSKVKWLHDEDRNSSFLHASIRGRHCRNALSSLSINGEPLEDLFIIKDHIIGFYSDLFSSDPSQFERNFSVVDDQIHSLVTDAENSFLISIPFANDIHEAMFVMDATSAPGPDGFSRIFISDVGRVLQAFGFSPIFLDFINNILCSSRLSVLINGTPEGYFSCCRGVRQGDHLSPLLFDQAVAFSLLLRGTVISWPYSQGGLGLTDLGLLNDSLLTKLTWKVTTSEGFAYSFLQERNLKQLRKLYGAYITSLIWSSFRAQYSKLLKEGIWLIGENSRQDFWRDNWLGVPILELLEILDYLASPLRARVSDFFLGWHMGS
ncbi:hypothetical protein Dsin_001554 [Dipteronia sinensis]|uniref:Reverse transcriptase domain-containing protein n=1 Tax=Dipteronia sinensis TaxID=43782 RepID=A0AAE0EIF5_9ROSI|nr:hypothetical protein Dsin_001554 [Dipteronia sinensis]